MNDLDIPPEVAGAREAHEMIRFWVVDGEEAVQLLIGAMGEDEPVQWGSILADIARHAVNAMAQKDPSLDADILQAQIENGFNARLASAQSVRGTLRGTLQ